MGRKKAKTSHNSRGIITCSSQAKAQGASNVCLVPVPGCSSIPVPLSSLAKSDDLKNYVDSVKIGKGFVCTTSSEIDPSSGDEVGTDRGILSGSKSREVRLLTSSPDLKIEGQGVGRHADLTLQNHRNTIGRMNESFVASEEEAFESIAEEVATIAICQICRSGSCKGPKAKKNGNHLRKVGRSIRDRIRDTYNRDLGAPVEGKDIWFGHPWAIVPESLQGHHLIDCLALLSDEIWSICCKLFGYDINDVENGVMLPCLENIACALRLPLHKGPHKAALIYDALGNPVKKDTESSDAPVESLGDKRKKKGRKKKVAKDKVFLCYPEAVRDLIKPISDAAEDGEFCADAQKFIDNMIAASADVLTSLADFSWTLSAHGRKYIDGGVGCCQEESGQSSGESLSDLRSQLHLDIIDFANNGTFKHLLQVGR